MLKVQEIALRCESFKVWNSSCSLKSTKEWMCLRVLLCDILWSPWQSPEQPEPSPCLLLPGHSCQSAPTRIVTAGTRPCPRQGQRWGAAEGPGRTHPHESPSPASTEPASPEVTPASGSLELHDLQGHHAMSSSPASPHKWEQPWWGKEKSDGAGRAKHGQF